VAKFDSMQEAQLAAQQGHPVAVEAAEGAGAVATGGGGFRGLTFMAAAIGVPLLVSAVLFMATARAQRVQGRPDSTRSVTSIGTNPNMTPRTRSRALRMVSWSRAAEEPGREEEAGSRSYRFWPVDEEGSSCVE